MGRLGVYIIAPLGRESLNRISAAVAFCESNGSAGSHATAPHFKRNNSRCLWASAYIRTLKHQGKSFLGMEFP